MNKIIYGNRIFTDTQIESGDVHLVTNLISSQLEANTFTVVVRTSDASIINFDRNAKLTVYLGDRQAGIFYVQSIDRAGPDKYKIFAYSAVGLLIDGVHYGGIYTGQALLDVVSEICGSIPFIIKNNLLDIKLYGWLPIASRRDNLSQVLFAAGAALRTDLNGVLRIETLWDGLSGAVGKDKMYLNGSVEYASGVSRVIVTEHQFAEGGDAIKLFDGTAQRGDIITFSEPVYNLSASGISILERGANYAVVSSGNGTLTGRKYIHNTRQIVRNVTVERNGDNSENVRTVDNATLVSLVNSVSVADRLANYYKCLETIRNDIVMDKQSTGDCVVAFNPYDLVNVRSCIESLDIKMSKTLKASMRALVGFKPLQVAAMEYYNKRELLTVSGTFIVPEGTTSIRFVLIQGGAGGQAGYNGAAGEAGANPNSSDSPGTGAAGAGGAAGARGNPGRVYVVDVEVSPGNAVTYRIGTAGQGGASNGASGSQGGHTTVTVNGVTYSSASGTFSDNGYVDQITGDVYAVSGSNGIKGGKGGEGGTKALDGESVGSYAGGKAGISREYTDVYGSAAYGGGGGGAAYGNSGSNGGDARVNSGGMHKGYGGPGGNGASAVAPYSQSGIGSGGNGGHGGGGGGGGGSTINSNTIFNEPGAGGSAGSGSRGSSGGPGGLIMYYSQAKPLKSGALMDKSKRFILDKTGRIIVV